MNGLRSARSARRPIVLGVLGAALAAMLTAGLVQAATATIVMEHFAFSPSPLTISIGTTVTWINKDPTQHLIKSDTGAFPSSGLLDQGQKYSVKFSKAGTFNYYDAFGGFMRGTIIVTAAPKATPKPTPKPAPKPTPKPTVKPTAPPNAAPTLEVTPVPTIVGASPSPAGSPGSETPGSGSTGASGGSGGSDSSGSGGSFDPGGVVIGFGLAVLAFLAGIGVQAIRRERAGLPPGGGPTMSGLVGRASATTSSSAVGSPVAVASPAASAGPAAVASPPEASDPGEPAADTAPDPEPDIDEDRPLHYR